MTEVAPQPEAPAPAPLLEAAPATEHAPAPAVPKVPRRRIQTKDRKEKRLKEAEEFLKTHTEKRERRAKLETFEGIKKKRPNDLKELAKKRKRGERKRVPRKAVLEEVPEESDNSKKKSVTK